MSQIETTAREVFDVASRKGALFVTNDRGSDELVGFFVPATAVNALGKALARKDEFVSEPGRGMFDATRPFVAEPYDRTIDKSITITGPEDLTLSVDFDDVNHPVVEALLPLVVDYLNAIPRDAINDVVLRAAQAEADETEGS